MKINDRRTAALWIIFWSLTNTATTPVFSTLIGPGPTRLSLVESFGVLLVPAILGHKDPTRYLEGNALMDHFLPTMVLYGITATKIRPFHAWKLYILIAIKNQWGFLDTRAASFSLWHRDTWFPCRERIDCAIKNHRWASCNFPGLWMPELVLYGIRLMA